ncbi:hypothetical protein N658DRAFT_516008 [Parathielavia hyrcaniae]|uniref:Small ribosomal subunit protein uS5m n=1 Tax=Parathielavia hyrcaniae TaxID=113614 RepID=A0AAN6Q2C2_9PEZI|nr:hypothetical protein N658DRAFT_516008 [Parathielavia hyrcaniae]
MSVARPVARRLVSGRLAAVAGAPCAAPTPTPTPTATTAAPCQQVFAHRFHSSPQLSARRRPRFANVRAADMGLMTEKQIDDFTTEKFPRYTKEELDLLRTKYSPAQIAALEAGEAAINPRDLTVQGRLRNDPYTLPYIDDFAETQPIIDKRAKNKEAPDPSARFMNMDEFTQDLILWADKFPVGDVTGQLKTLVDFVPEDFKTTPEGNWPGEVREAAHKAFQLYLESEVGRQNKGKDVDDVEGGPTDADILQYILERSAMTDDNRTTDTSLAHALPSKVPGVAGKYKQAIDPEDQGLDDLGVYQDVKRRTGLSVAELLKVQTKQLVIRTVSNQTRLGKVRKVSAIYCAGNGNGWLGIGEAKSTEFSIALNKARLMAMQSMKPIRRYENRTIYGTVESKISGTIVRMSARPPGFGLRVSHRIFEMCRAAGITDLAASIPRSRNPMNTVKAAYKALLTQPDPEEIAMGRGKKLVDVRKVYYGGAVY